MQASRAGTFPAVFLPRFQKYIRFLPFVVSDFTGVWQKQANKCLLLTCFTLIRCPFDLLECRRKLEVPCVNICRLLYSEYATNDTHPPPIWGRKKPFTPIIFRTKNPEKSRLGRLEKISEKICGKMFLGKRKAPNLVERGLGAKIRKIGLRVQR